MCSSIFPSTVSFRTLPIRGTHGFSFHPIGEDSVTWPCQPPGSLEYSAWHLKVLVIQSYPSLCNSMDCSLPGSSVHGILQARIVERVPSLLQGIFPTRGWNLGLPYCRQVLHHLSHQGSPHGHMPSHEFGGSMTFKERRAVGGRRVPCALSPVNSLFFTSRNWSQSVSI